MKTRFSEWRHLKLSRLKSRFAWLRNWLRKNPEPLTLLLMTRGHQQVHKIHLRPQWIRGIKITGVSLAVLLIVGFLSLLNFFVSLPDNYRLEKENLALKNELLSLQFHLDSLQATVDRINRFNQKLRVLTDVDKEFAKRKGPLGQGGEADESDEEGFEFGDFKVQIAGLNSDQDSEAYLERRDRFLVEKMYSWMNRILRQAQLETQSVEELYEVLKGRKLQLASTPSIIPVKGWVTSHFGYRIDPFTGRRGLHKGLDVVARRGTPIIAPADGVVSFVGPYGTYGNAVMVFHGYGISTLYAHTDDDLVRIGQKVRRGDVLATVGSTGRSTAPHLHYELILHGVRVDPKKYILDKSL